MAHDTLERVQKKRRGNDSSTSMYKLSALFTRLEQPFQFNDASIPSKLNLPAHSHLEWCKFPSAKAANPNVSQIKLQNSPFFSKDGSEATSSFSYARVTMIALMYWLKLHQHEQAVKGYGAERIFSATFV